MIKIVQEGTVFLELESMVDHGVHARLVFQSAPPSIAFFDERNEEGHPTLHGCKVEL
jgi:hypothetical protein